MTTTNNYEKTMNDILNNQGIFMVQYHSVKQYVANRLVDYINYNFERLLDIVDYNEKTLENSFVKADKVLKMHHIDLSTKIQDQNIESMPYAVDFIFDLCAKFLNDQYIRVKMGQIKDTRVTFQVEIMVEKKPYGTRKDAVRFPKLMVDRMTSMTGIGPFVTEEEIIFEESKLFSQLRTFSEVVDYTVHLINTVQNKYKDLCKHYMHMN